METATKKNNEELEATPEQTAIVEAVKVIGDPAQANEDQDTAVFTAAMVDGKMSIAAAGSPANLVKLLARTINASKDMRRIIESAVEAAPLVSMFDGLLGQDDGEPCNCKKCVQRRKEAAADTTVN